jgi:hypothetical protein
LLDDRHVFYRSEDALEGVLDGQDITRGQGKTGICPGIKERRRVREELQPAHGPVKLILRPPDVSAIPFLRGRDGAGDSLEHSRRRFNDLALLVLAEVPPSHDLESIGRQLRYIFETPVILPGPGGIFHGKPSFK